MNVPRARFLAATVFCGVFSVSAGDESGDPFSRYVAENAGFHAYSRVGNGYISTSGNISDTEPVAIECISGEVKIGDCGEIGGYVWTISKLHGKCDDTQRRAFYEFETGVWYRYPWEMAEGWTVDTKICPIWDTCPGIKTSEHVVQEFMVNQSLENRYLTPYYSFLLGYAPDHWFRTRIGVRKTFEIYENVTLTPYIETVYSDARRYRLKYGDRPDSFWEGFSSLISVVTLRWNFTENWNVHLIVKQYDLVDRNARRAISARREYYQKTDHTLFTLGVGCDF
jgi:hypothetical protein